MTTWPADPASCCSRRTGSSTSVKPHGITCTRATRLVRAYSTPPTGFRFPPTRDTWLSPSSSATKSPAAQRSCRHMPYSAGGRPRSLSPASARTVREARIPDRHCLHVWPDRRQPTCQNSPRGSLRATWQAGHGPNRLEFLDAAFNADLAATLTRCIDSTVAALAGFFRSGSAPPGQHEQQQLQQQLDSLRRTLTVLVTILARHSHSPGITAAQGRSLRGHGRRSKRGSPSSWQGRRDRAGHRRPATVEPSGRPARRCARPSPRGPARPGQ